MIAEIQSWIALINTQPIPLLLRDEMFANEITPARTSLPGLPNSMLLALPLAVVPSAGIIIGPPELPEKFSKSGSADCISRNGGTIDEGNKGTISGLVTLPTEMPMHAGFLQLVLGLSDESILDE